MKRAPSLALLLDRQTPWLAWWQELILNWVASWPNVTQLEVTSADGLETITWQSPSPLDRQRQHLEQLLRR